MAYRATVAIDFDGVIHSYTSGWQGAGVIPDPPNDDMKPVIEALLREGYAVVIMSSRAATDEGKLAIYKWLKHYGFPELPITDRKPPAVAYVDDRAVPYNGNAFDVFDEIMYKYPIKKGDLK